MEKDEAINIFIKENINTLSSPSSNSGLVKQMRLDFLRKYRLKASSRFKNKEISKALVKYITKLKKNQHKDEILKDLKKIPFIFGELRIDQVNSIILQNITDEDSVITKIDLSKMQHDDYIKKMQNKFEEDAKLKAEIELEEEKQKLDDLIAETEKEREYLKNYRSELDQLPEKIEFDTEDLKIEKISDVKEKLWWKRIGLIGNPFPSNEKGLIGIPEELYDTVLVRTRFVDYYLTKVENNPEEFLGKSTAIIGEFGSGKTTLLDAIRYKLGNIGILPCEVMLILNPDAGSLMLEFLRQLGGGLKDLNHKLSNLNKNYEYGPIDSLSKLSDVLDDFKKYEGKGLVISVDGLHKESSYFPQTIEFLHNLQNVHEFIEHRGVPCGFLFAGSLFWEREIENVPSMSGSISKVDIIPPLSQEDAVEAIIRRIKSFSPSGKSAPIIKSDSIKTAFRTFSNRINSNVTFRGFIRHVSERLSVGDFHEIGIEVSAHFELIDEIQNFVNNSVLGHQFRSIEKEITNNPGLRPILCSILPKIYQFSGISESNQLFIPNKKVFNLLKTRGLIVQRKGKGKTPFVWSISPHLANILKDIGKKYKIPPEDSLTAIFEEKDVIIKKEVNTIYSSTIKRIKNFSITLRSSWPEISRQLDETVNITEKIEKNVIDENLDNIEYNQLEKSCDLLLQCVFLAGGKKVNPSCSNREIFTNFWYNPENIEEIIRFCEINKKDFNTQSEIFGLLHRHTSLLSQLMDLLVELTKGEGISRLINRKLSNADLLKIHEARSMFLNQRYKKTVDVICGLLEQKVRDVAYPILRAIWGEKYIEIIPRDINEKLENLGERGHPRTKRKPDENLFYNISRSEHSKIIFRNPVYKGIFGNIPDSDLKKIKESWEIAFSLDDRQAHRDRPSYFREHATEIGDVLRVLPKICEYFTIAILRFLKELEFKYNSKGGAAIGKYYFEDNINIKTNEHVITNKESDRIMKTILASIERYPRQVIPLDNILIVEGTALEFQIATLNAMIRRKLLDLDEDFYIKINNKGKEHLNKMMPFR